METERLVYGLIGLGCCVIPLLGMLIIAFGQIFLSRVIGEARAKKGMNLPLKRKGFAGMVREAQKGERLRIEQARKQNREVRLHSKLDAIEYRLSQLEDNPIYQGELLSPTDFELRVADIFKSLGYRVTHTGRTNDGGIDLIITKGSKAGAAQCKYYKPSNLVGSPEVRNLRGAMARDGYTYGFFITSSSFTQNAIREAKGSKIRLIDATALKKLEKEAGRHHG